MGRCGVVFFLRSGALRGHGVVVGNWLNGEMELGGRRYRSRFGRGEDLYSEMMKRVSSFD